MDSANSLRIVPSAASAGSVAPITSRYVAMASSAFQNLHHDGLGRHEVAELTVEGTFLVDGVELACLRRGHVDALLRDDAKARGLDLGVDRAGEVTLGGVGLDDRKGALKGHDGASSQREERPQAAPF